MAASGPPISPPPPNEVLVLNVGGILHTTTRSTLARFPYSMLGSMFSGRFTPSLLLDKEGHVFIDRDGELFRIVLNFLRTSRLCLPSGFKDVALLEVEADFYQIPELIQAVREYSEARQARANPPLAGYYLEIVEYEETAYFSRFYTAPPTRPHCNGSFKSGGLVVSGHRDALLSLPLQSRTLDVGEGVDRTFQTVPVSTSDKMPLFHYLARTGWILINSSFSYGSDTDGSYIVHKYIWQAPLPRSLDD